MGLGRWLSSMQATLAARKTTLSSLARTEPKVAIERHTHAQAWILSLCKLRQRSWQKAAPVSWMQQSSCFAKGTAADFPKARVEDSPHAARMGKHGRPTVRVGANGIARCEALQLAYVIP